MKMNLRENKMDQFSEAPKKKFFGLLKGAKDTPKIEQPQQNTPVAPLQSQKNIAPVRENQKIAAPQPKVLLQAARVKANDVPDRTAWVRKDPQPPLPQNAFDFQRNYEHVEEHSDYIKTFPQHVLVKWRGPEFEHYPRDKQWYMTAALVLCGIVVYAVFTDSIIMAIVFILIGLTGYLFLSRPQKVVDFAITYEGVLVGNEIYEFDDIKSFWIFYEPPHTRVISLHMKDHFRPYLHIPLHQVDPVKVHEVLTQYIPEIKQEQNLVDIMERLLRV